jgi:transglutaminase-like putative cysteine protease
MPGSIGQVLVMNPLLPQKTLIFLLISLGLITLPHSQHLPVPLFLFFCLLWGWRFIGVWKPEWLPGKHVIFLLTMISLGLLYTQQVKLFGRDGGTAVFVTALGLKLLEIRSSRDVYFIIYLGFVVAAAEFLYQQSIAMALYIIAVCIVLLATLISINGLHGKTMTTVKKAAIIFFQAMPIAAIVFVMFPRIEVPKFQWLESDQTEMSGLKNTLEPGAISELGLSAKLAFRVKFDGEIPPPEQRYWRGPVFSYTDGKRWRESQHRFFRRFMDRPRFKGKAYHYTILMEPQAQHWVYALEMPADYGKDLHRNSFYQLITEKDPAQRAEYTVTSYPDYYTGYITKTELEDNLQLPGEPSARIKALVKQLGGFDQSPSEFIKNLFRHFREENFFYTLMPKKMEDNPIETFLFERRYGFCSHYATAFVYLMRVANIPARVVGGYQGGEINEAGKFLEVRQANAHAWAEVWLQGKGWTRFDPTSAVAPERIEQAIDIEQQIASRTVVIVPPELLRQSVSWLKHVKQLWGSVDYSWQRWIINYNQNSQKGIFERLGIQDIKTMVYWLLVLVGVTTLVIARFMFNHKPKPVDQAVRLYQKFLRKIPDVSIEPGETPYAFAKRCQKKHPEQADAIHHITELFIKLRYYPERGKVRLDELKKHIDHFSCS